MTIKTYQIEVPDHNATLVLAINFDLLTDERMDTIISSNNYSEDLLDTYQGDKLTTVIHLASEFIVSHGLGLKGIYEHRDQDNAHLFDEFLKNETFGHGNSHGITLNFVQVPSLSLSTINIIEG